MESRSPVSGTGPLTRARSVILIASELRDSLGIGGFRAASRSPPCRGSAGCERAAAPLPTSITACQGIVRSRDAEPWACRAPLVTSRKPSGISPRPTCSRRCRSGTRGKVSQQQMSRSDRFFLFIFFFPPLDGKEEKDAAYFRWLTRGDALRLLVWQRHLSLLFELP